MDAYSRSSKFLLDRALRRSGVLILMAAAILCTASLGLPSHALAEPQPTFTITPHSEMITGGDWPTGAPITISVYATSGALSPLYQTTVASDNVGEGDEAGNFAQYLGGPSGCDRLLARFSVCRATTRRPSTYLMTSFLLDDADGKQLVLPAYRTDT